MIEHGNEWNLIYESRAYLEARRVKQPLREKLGRELKSALGRRPYSGRLLHKTRQGYRKIKLHGHLIVYIVLHSWETGIRTVLILGIVSRAGDQWKLAAQAERTIVCSSLGPTDTRLIGMPSSRSIQIT